MRLLSGVSRTASWSLREGPTESGSTVGSPFAGRGSNTFPEMGRPASWRASTSAERPSRSSSRTCIHRLQATFTDAGSRRSRRRGNVLASGFGSPTLGRFDSSAPPCHSPQPLPRPGFDSSTCPESGNRLNRPRPSPGGRFAPAPTLARRRRRSVPSPACQHPRAGITCPPPCGPLRSGSIPPRPTR